jgi:transcription initiation factor TFIID subunit 11
LPQSLPSDEEDDEEEEEDEDEEDKDNAGVSHNEGVLFEKESGKGSQQEAEDEEEMKMVEQWDREDREKQAIEYGEKMKILLSKFTKEQLERYEYYRRSAFPKAVMKRLIKQIAGTPISSETSIVISGITKIFVGELVETAREVMREWRESGPIRPVHLREAYRRLKEKDPLLSSSKYNKKLFRR